MTVVFHSFDVFKILILPFDKGLSDSKFSSEFGIFVIVLFKSIMVLIMMNFTPYIVSTVYRTRVL